jgi:hypothetical protein
MEPSINKELYNVMDALVALKIDLSCEPHIPGETLVLSAEKSRSACNALDSAFGSIKKLVAVLDGNEAGGEPRH